MPGLLGRDNEANIAAPRSDLWYLGFSYPIFPTVTLDAEVFRLSYSNSQNQATLAAIRATYFLSKRTVLYATAGNFANERTLAVSVSGGGPPGLAPNKGGSQTGTMFGMRHSF